MRKKAKLPGKNEYLYKKFEKRFDVSVQGSQKSPKTSVDLGYLGVCISCGPKSTFPNSSVTSVQIRTKLLYEMEEQDWINNGVPPELAPDFITYCAFLQGQFLTNFPWIFHEFSSSWCQRILQQNYLKFFDILVSSLNYPNVVLTPKVSTLSVTQQQHGSRLNVLSQNHTRADDHRGGTTDPQRTYSDDMDATISELSFCHYSHSVVDLCQRAAHLADFATITDGNFFSRIFSLFNAMCSTEKDDDVVGWPLWHLFRWNICEFPVKIYGIFRSSLQQTPSIFLRKFPETSVYIHTISDTVQV